MTAMIIAMGTEMITGTTAQVTWPLPACPTLGLRGGDPILKLKLQLLVKVVMALEMIIQEP